MTLDVNSADNFYMNGHAVDRIFFHGVEIWPNYVNNKNIWFYITPVASSGDLDINLSSGSSIEYSKDTVNWITDTNTITTVSVSTGEKVYFRNTIGTTTNGFSLSPDFNYSVGGNLSSLYYGSGFNGQIIIDFDINTNGKSSYSNLFINSINLIFANNLIIPFCRYADYDYNSIIYFYTYCDRMFEGCSNLRTPPNITIMTSENRPSDATKKDRINSFGSMFKNCTSLQYVPNFPTNFEQLNWLIPSNHENACLRHMFEGCESLTSTLDFEGGYAPAAAYMYKNCTSLQTAPQMPFTRMSYNAASGFDSMFENCTSLTAAPELSINEVGNWGSSDVSYNTIPGYAYHNMFKGCTSLRRVQSSLPATTLSNRCYEGMFEGCTSLVNIPSNFLPATDAPYMCYHRMFYGCTSLVNAPELPATTLSGYYCYGGMFQECTSLTSAPELPATTLDQYCYEYMFQGCTSLTSAPELLADTLQTGCYQYMFSNCPSLNYIKCLATRKTAGATDCTSNWTNGVSQTGTFIKSSNAAWTTGVNGIPSGWTVQNA